MKEIVITVLSFCLAQFVFGQLSSGTYIFKSGDPNFHWQEYSDYDGSVKYQDFIFKVIIDYEIDTVDRGHGVFGVIRSIQFGDSEEILKDGYFRVPSLNTGCVDCSGWYEFQTDRCKYSFNEPQDGRIILQRFSCVDQCDNQKIGLTLIQSY
ncbi:MAG: hypothetical protein ACPGYF_05120 [Chitinophagales bacterium]